MSADNDSLRGNLRVYAKCLHSRRHGAGQRVAIGRVNIAGDAKPVTIHALNQIDHDRPITGADLVGHFIQMPRAARGHGIGKLRRSRIGAVVTLQMHILYLDPALSPIRVIQQDIDPGFLAILHFPA